MNPLCIVLRTVESVKKRWDELLSFLGDGQYDALASCFMHLGVIKEERSQTDEQEGDAIVFGQFPGEEYFCHPYAVDAAQMVRSGQVTFVPPTHHHCHDYCLTIDDRYPVVVGEAMSGENYPDELQKCMPGVMKMLNIYETAISMTSSSSQCDISYYHLGHQLAYSGVKYPVIAGRTIKCRCSGSEDDYPNYILKILVCLETAVMGWLNTNGGVVVAAEPATIGTQKSGGMDFEPGTKVNIPGVYCGNNFPWVAENVVTMMSMYL